MTNRKILAYHSYSGLLVGIFLILMGLSGAVLVFQHDIEDLRWEDYYEIEEYQGFFPDRAIQTIQTTYPDWDTRLIHFEKGEALVFNLRRPTQRLFVFVHPSSGQIIQELNELTTLTRWLLKFHYSFQAGVPGRMLVLIMGILFLFSLCTGFYVYRKSILKTLLFRVPVKRKNPRTLYSSLHRIIGVWALFFNMILVITGILLSYTVVTASLNPPPPPTTPRVVAPVKQLLEDLAMNYPEFTPTYLRLPVNNGTSITVYGHFDDDPFYYSEFYNSVRAHYHSGKVISVTRVQDADLLTKFNSSLLPLHFGQYGGIISKLIYCLTGLSGPFLSISGFIIWQKRRSARRKKKK